MKQKNLELRSVILRTTILMLLLFLIPFGFEIRSAQGQSFNLQFQHFQPKEGLADSNVHDILQDRQGYLWFATNNGLSRYDGYSFTNFLHQNDNPHSLSDNFTHRLFEDSQNHFWICTRNGLSRFLPESNTFMNFYHNPNDRNSLNSNCINAIVEGASGTLWIGTANGLNHYNPQTNTFSIFLHDPQNPNSLSSNIISSLYLDSQGFLWIGTIGGSLNRYDPIHQQFTRYLHEPGNPNTLNATDVTWMFETSRGEFLVGTWYQGIHKMNREEGTFQQLPILESVRVTRCLEDREGKIWIASWDKGVYYYDPQNQSLLQFTHNPSDPESITSDSIASLYEDRSGMIWIGTLYGGINAINHNIHRFINYTIFPREITNTNIFSLYEDGEGILWIGIYKCGLIRFDRDSNQWDFFSLPGTEGFDFGNSVLSILEDRQGRLWVGSYRFGLYCFDRKERRFLPTLPYIVSDQRTQNTFNNDSIRSIWQDSEGSLWVATDENGLLQIDESGNLLHQFLPDSQNLESISDRHVSCIFPDLPGKLWIGTDGGGLNHFDVQSHRFVHYEYDPNDPESISSNRISIIAKTRIGDLWIGTVDGLNRFNPTNGRFKRYYQNEGIPGNRICGMIEDASGFWWISTNKGIGKFDPITGTSKNYDHYDGLSGDDFSTRCSWVNRQGEIFFGGTNGITSFHPQNIVDNSYKPPIVITDFQIMGKSVFTDQRIQPEKPVSILYQDKYFSFAFAALDFTNTMKNQYAYKLEGFNQDWIECGNLRYANYTNLDPGSYTLRIKGSNNDGFWNEEGISIPIVILPPFWMTWWFRSLVVLSCLAILVLGYWRKIKHFKQEQIWLRDQVEQRTHEIMEKNKELENTIREREEAMKKIKTLSGLIPICAKCKKVRTDEGFWNQIEDYIAEHSNADFTHSICPDCVKNLYPKLYDEMYKTE